MKRRNLGDIEITTDIYWSGGKNSEQLKRNETLCFAEIDLCQELANIAKSDVAIQAEYGKIDMYYTCLKAIEFFGTQPLKLEAAGLVIGKQAASGAFSQIFSSVEDRNVYLNELIEEMKQHTLNDDFLHNENPTFFAWWQSNILDLNYWKTPDQIAVPPMAGLGAGSTSDTYSEQAKEGGMYWMYLAGGLKPENDIQTRKLLAHNRYVNWFDKGKSNLSRASMMTNSRAQIIKETGKTPEAYLLQLKEEANTNGGVQGLGWIMVLLGAITAIVGLITKIISAKDSPDTSALDAGTVEEPSKDTLENNGADLSDLVGKILQNGNNSATEAGSSWLWWTLGAGAVVSVIVAALFNKPKKGTLEKANPEYQI